MESKEKMNLETQQEVENSVNQPELDNEKETVEKVSEEDVENTISEVETPTLENTTEEVVVNTDDAEEVAEVENLVEESKSMDEPVVVETEEIPSVSESVEKTEEAAVLDTQEAEVEPVMAEATTEVVEDEGIAPVSEGVEAAALETPAEETKEEVEEPEVNYATFSELELVNALSELMETADFITIYNKIDVIKINFYKKNKVKVQAQKKKFLEEGGVEEEFKAEENPYEQDLKRLLDEFRQRKADHNKEIENEKDNNVKIKYEIIEDIKSLINRKESINKTFQDFKDLQQKWRDVGLVPQANMKDLWENYHHHVENFYDYIKINKELRDLDLKKNQEEKINLCEKAEELLIEPSVIKAFNTLQKLHETWREVGPVPREKKEELWERFKDTTTKINKKHQDFFENRKKAQKKNLESKTALCEKVEEILALEMDNHKEWEEKSKELVELQKYWRTIGFTPKKENNAIYERFRIACDSFFDKKREFYSQHKEVQSNNLQMKIDLCVQAEALKDSTEWKKTTDEFISIQKKWKDIGPIPRKHSDAIWKRFRSACDFFFENKSKFFNSKDETQVENLKLKNDLIDAVVNFVATSDDESSIEKLRDFQRTWNDIGHVPIGDKNDVQKRFRDAINVQFDKLGVENKERNLMKFKSKMTDWKTSSRGHNKMYAERDKYASKLKQLESDLITLQNNIGFFANSKGAEALIKDVEQKILNNEEQIIYLKEKIRVIDDVEYNEE